MPHVHGLRAMHFLRPPLLILLAFCCYGCDERAGAASSKAVTELRFWNGFTGPDGRKMLEIVKRFNAANPDVHVIMQRMEWATYYNKVFVANLGGRGPDVFVIHTDHISRFQQAGFLRPTDDIDIDFNDFDPNVWTNSRREGKHWTIPLDIHLLGMFYNRRLFKDAGINRPPTNRAEFLDATRRLTKNVTPNGHADQWGFVFTWLRTNLYTFFRQNGGDIFSADRTRCTLNSPQNVEALQWACDLIATERVAPSPQNLGGFIGFRQGKVGMLFEGIYMLHDLQVQTDLDWDAAPVPQLFGRRAAWCSSHNLCIRPELDATKTEAAKRFVKFLSDNSLDWAAAGQVPVRKSLRESDRFQHRGEFASAPDDYRAQRAFATQIPDAAYMPSVPFINEYIAELDRAIEASLLGRETPTESLDLATRNIENVMRRYGVQSTSARRGRFSDHVPETQQLTRAENPS